MSPSSATCPPPPGAAVAEGAGALAAERGGRAVRPRRDPGVAGPARPAEVEREFRAQIDAVLDAGLAPAHLDWHCLADGGREGIRDLTLI
nr:ChbG/HpnK family deacetylase [Streptomyces botrytidirepellens]